MPDLPPNPNESNSRWFDWRSFGHRVFDRRVDATPNHGTKLARLRLAAEIREQVERMSAGNGGFLDGILDGAVEAKIDLLPGSEFLTTLNSRKLPPDVHFTIIAWSSVSN